MQIRGRLRWWLRRLQVRRQIGAGALEKLPVVIGNAIPKNGSKLLFNILRGGLPRIGPFVDTGLNAIKPYMDGQPTPENWILSQLEALQPGDVRVGYLHASPAHLEAVCRPGRAVFQILRDPRDTVISGIFYAMEVHPNHLMREYYSQQEGLEDRITTAMRGIPDGKFQFADINTIYERYLGWLERPEVCVLRFEDLVGDPEAQLSRLLDHLEAHGFAPGRPRDTDLATLIAQMDPRKSGTFRKGKAGGWREHFTPEHKELFNKIAGELLIRLGYEEDLAW